MLESGTGLVFMILYACIENKNVVYMYYCFVVLTGCVDLLTSVCHRIIPYLKERTEQSDIHIPCLTINSTLDSIQHLLK